MTSQETPLPLSALQPGEEGIVRQVLAQGPIRRRLLEMGYPHEYTERPGEHNGHYWGRAVDFQVLFFHKFFEER